jgi:SAM-dependent methyltransferase
MTSEFDIAQTADAYPVGIENGFWSIARHRIIARALKDATAAGLRSPAGRILEIGCGPGIVVNAMRAEGYDVWGVELGTPSVRQAAASYITTGIPAQQLNASFRATVETVLLLDVIEHIEDEVIFLRSVLPAFPNCRCVIVTVPARQEVWSNYDDYYGHFRRYTRESLDNTLTEAGLTTQHTRYFFRSLYGIAILINALGHKRAVVLKAPKSSVLQHLIALGFELEDRLFSSLSIPGLSLISIARIGPDVIAHERLD